MSSSIEKLFYSAIKSNTPISCTLEITNICNFKCLHCYNSEASRNYISFPNAKKILDELSELGCIYLVLTGGEIFTHPYFNEIYLYAIKKGFVISLFTNGSLVDNKISILKKYPPQKVEITFYGFSEKSYISCTKSKCFEKVKNNVLILKKHKINISLKMFILKENFKDFFEFVNFCETNNIKYKYDYIIITSDNLIKRHQITNNEITKIIENEKLKGNEIKRIINEKALLHQNDNLFQCGAGKISCWIKSNLEFKICTFYDYFKISLKKYTIKEAWNLSTLHIESLKSCNNCKNCVLYKYCDICPAKYAYINGDIWMENCVYQYKLIAQIRRNIDNDG